MISFSRQVENSIQPWFCLEWWNFYKGLITTICSPSSTYGSHTKFKCCLSPSLPIYVRHLTHLYNSTYFPHLICMSFHICSMFDYECNYTSYFKNEFAQ
jgi:hypothetical protein